MPAWVTISDDHIRNLVTVAFGDEASLPAALAAGGAEAGGGSAGLVGNLFEGMDGVGGSEHNYSGAWISRAVGPGRLDTVAVSRAGLAAQIAAARNASRTGGKRFEEQVRAGQEKVGEGWQEGH